MFDPAMLQMMMMMMQGGQTPGAQASGTQGGSMTGLLDMMSSKLGDMGKQQPPPMQSSYNPGQAYQAWLQMQNKKGLLR